MRNILFLLYLFPVILIAATPSQQLAALLTKTNTMQASFVQRVVNGNSNLTRQSSGKMALQRPGKFRWQVTKPNQQLIIANDKQVLIYDADLQQVTKKRFNASQPDNPVQLLSGSVRELSQQYVITKGDGWYRLKPKQQGASLQKIALKFDQGKLQQLLILDNLGQQSVITFSRIRTNVVLPKRLFYFVPPKGVDVIRE